MYQAYQAQGSSPAPQPEPESRGETLRGLALLASSIVIGAGVALWLVGWSVGWNPLGIIAWSVQPTAGVAVQNPQQAASVPQVRSGLVPTNENRGLVLFGRYCDSCHPGGQQAAGPSLIGKGFADRYRDLGSVISFVRKGGFAMPAYKPELLADADLALIASYVLLLNGTEVDEAAIVAASKPAAPPPAAAQAAGQAPAVGNVGDALYSKNCEACHPGGGAGMGPSLRSATFKSNFKTADQLAQLLRAGKGTMPAFAANRLSDADLNDLVEYVLGLSEKN